MSAVQRLGTRAWRLPRPQGKSAAALLAAARAWPGVVDAWLTEAWLAVETAQPEPDAGWAPRLAELAALPAAESQAGREHTLDVRYDGPDLADVARARGMTPDRVVALHTGVLYTVLFVGFLPGFAYLAGLPRELESERLPSPRPRVPKNAVAIGGPYSGVYPLESPGGWRLLGTARGVELFDPARGALLHAGDRVRFREAL